MNSQDKTKEELLNDLQALKQAYDALKDSYEENINQQKLTKDALRESESKYRLLTQNSSDVIWTLDNDYHFTYISPSVYQLRGMTPEEAMRETIQDTMPPHSLKVVYEAMAEGKKNEQMKIYHPVQIEIEQYHKDGHLVWVEISLRAMINDKGEKIGYVGASRDISKRKMAEKALQQSEANFRSLVDQAKVIISIVGDTEGSKFLYVNDEWSRVQGYSKEEALKLRPIDLVAPELKNKILDFASKRMRGDSVPYNYELKTMTKSGEVRYFDFSPIIINFENQRAFLTTSIDLTERKKIEETLRESEAKLRDTNAQKDKFFSIIAHDLMNPFNSIMGFSQLLLDRMKEKDYQGIEEYAEMIAQSSTQSMELLKNLLEWSRAQTGRLQYKPEQLDLVDLIGQYRMLFDLIAYQKSISIRTVLPPEIRISADRQMISTVLRNLLSNAIKFTREGGVITVSAEQRVADVLVAVSDNGVGIAPERLEKLFSIDENDSTPGTNNEQGTGLGLILCKEFVKKHGGEIWVESEYGKGSTFYFTLSLNERSSTSTE